MREREGMGEGRERKGRMDEGEEEREWRENACRVFPSVWTYLNVTFNCAY